CFFFQAEDGIRDFHVTGVQTCALPIWGRRLRLLRPGGDHDRDVGAARDGLVRPGLGADHVVLRHGGGGLGGGGQAEAGLAQGGRSEERRVGKERRARGGEADVSKKKRR